VKGREERGKLQFISNARPSKYGNSIDNFLAVRHTSILRGSSNTGMDVKHGINSPRDRGLGLGWEEEEEEKK